MSAPLTQSQAECPACWDRPELHRICSLHASAPKLLAALEELLEQIAGIGISDWHGAEGLDLLQARTAIHEAKPIEEAS